MNPMPSASSVAISIVVPVYKEEKNIRPFVERLEAVFAHYPVTYELIFALDPSPDATEAVIRAEIERNPHIRLLTLSRRFGQSAATIAGLMLARGESVGAIDVDLQDPPELIPALHQKILDGYDVAYAQRRSRVGETWFKRLMAYTGYAIINKISDLNIPRNTGDYRLVSRRVIEELRRFGEKPGYWRGLISYIGYRQIAVQFDREARFSGHGNYNKITGSISGGLNGVVGFSSRPLQLMSIMGALTALLSFSLAAWFLFAKLYGAPLPDGLSTTAILISFFAGVQLLGMGLLGEYIGRIYDEVKQRPPYIIDQKVNFPD